MIVIKNGLVHDGINPEAKVRDIAIENGKFVEASDQAAQVIDASGKEIYPGLIDAHCHLGLDGYGIGFEGQDYNEMNDIVAPHLRGLDSYNPLDPTILQAAKGGVTCVCTGPGSANVLGGTFIAVKPNGAHRVEDALVKNDVAMKCAFGENPKRVYRDKNNYARMSTAAKLREMLNKTFEYKAKKDAAGNDISKQPAYDMKLEALIPVIERKIPLKAHAHQANDIFTAIRIAEEFNVKLTLEHVTEGHLIVDELKKVKVPMAVGPSLTHASKFELQNKSFTTPGILAAAGCQVSIITDSPVIPQQYLAMCAGLAIKSGMDEFAALQAVTINPAKHIGIEERVGSIEIGKDADLIITNGSPFKLETQIEQVYINGQLMNFDCVES